MRQLVALLLLSPLLLPFAGCRLIDQTTFAPDAVAPAASQLSRAASPQRLPIASVRPADADDPWQAGLAATVQGTLERRPEAEFDLMGAIPSGRADPIRVATATQDARAVADALAASGVPAEKLHLGLHGDAGQPPREVLIYVR